MDKSNFQQKTRVINKLIDNGIKTEKDLQALTLVNVLEIKNITIPEIASIIELQKAVKSGKLFSYLGGCDETQDK